MLDAHTLGCCSLKPRIFLDTHTNTRSPILETEAAIVKESLNMFYYEWLTSNIYVIHSQVEGTNSIHKSITDATS
jgi:hypothetical protein